MKNFKLVSKYQPAGDQPKAIDELSRGIESGEKFQTMLGVTGSGKTFTICNVIERVNKPVLVISHNKTLAAQLYSEFKSFFPENAVEFFISYYDYYQPEAYIVSSDAYIEKDFAVNEEIDRLRLRATTSLIEGRRDVIIVASVSCIYGIGAPQEYADQIIFLSKGMSIKKKEVARRLVDIFYVRNDVEFTRGAFRVRGDVIDIIPAYQNEEAVRIHFFDDEIEGITIIDPLTGEEIREEETVPIYPAKYFVSNKEKIRSALLTIDAEMTQRVEELRSMDKFLEAQRLEQRTKYDMEMIKEVGYCSGIENYSRHLDIREPGSRPYCLFDYFSKNDYLLIIDESHVTIPQIRAMYNGDKARKMTLVEFGFRLPSALDNRPMKFEEFEQMMNQTVFISATPGDYELTKSEGVITELIIRPTGLLDPEVKIRPTKGQIDNLLQEIKIRSELKERVLVTTLTKKMAEDLADYFDKLGIRVRYIHSEVDALERVEILRDLRLGEFDVLIGVNLLREGLDLPEVSLVAIIDADKEGFLRSERSLLQTAGRTARNAKGVVILYADKITDSMAKMISETERRRILQTQYNEEHGITPQTIYKSREDILSSTSIADIRKKDEPKQNAQLSIVAEAGFEYMSFTQRLDFIQTLTDKMVQAAEDLDFDLAASLRDEIQRLRDEMEKRRN